MTGVLADALLASYLLGQFQINALANARATAPQASFAEPGDEPKKKKSKKSSSVVERSFDLPPADAIDYFEKKKIVRKKVFDQLSKEAKQGAFSVSRVYKDDVLAGFKDEIDSALREGRTQQETIKRFKSILDGAEHEQLGEFHLETVLRANMGMAYGVGRRSAMEDVTDAFPFWQYRGVGDDRERERHWALEGITLPANHPFWEAHYPPWEFNCRCSALPTDEIPDGYDAKNPSGEVNEYGEPRVQLSYDDEGMPAKAEIGTSLVDLTVQSKFAGVARGATLLSTIEAGATRAEDARGQGSGSRGRKKN